MTIEIDHKLTPEYDGDDAPTVNIDKNSVWFRDGGKYIALTHEQFEEAVRIYVFYRDMSLKIQQQNGGNNE